MKRLLLAVVSLSLFVAGTAFSAGEREYPARDITNVVVWAAGGGTDVCNRIISAEMAKRLKVNVNVTNVTGGVGGSVGMLEVFSKPHDGYTLAGISESCVTAGVQGGWDKGMNVWDPYIVGGSPDVVSVSPSTPYKTLGELIEAAKKSPDTIRAGASASGSIHHLNLLALEKGTGAKFNFIPYTGSAPAQNAAMSGEVSVVVTSVAEQAQLIRGGKLRVLAVLVPQDFKFGDATFPSGFTAYPGLAKYLPISQAIGFAVPRDTPVAAKQKITAAFDEAMKSDAVQKWLTDNYYVSSGLSGDAANKVFAGLESNFSWTLWDLGAAKVSPDKLGIPKP
ncbi:MAG TPA: tripartite tricarboxylate transporter substrate binding protein [Spirochaetia bacterium]|nr:tripartite tricarboxylate transporter substrate binding protein [Spirochaetia bacterium]